VNFIKREIIKKMKKNTRKKPKGVISSKKGKKTKSVKGQKRAAEYVSYLLELHKLQGVLLSRLNKEV